MSWYSAFPLFLWCEHASPGPWILLRTFKILKLATHRDGVTHLQYFRFTYAFSVSHIYKLLNISILDIDGLMQDCSNPIAKALELLQFCTKPSISTWNLLETLWLDNLYMLLACKVGSDHVDSNFVFLWINFISCVYFPWVKHETALDNSSFHSPVSLGACKHNIHKLLLTRTGICIHILSCDLSLSPTGWCLLPTDLVAMDTLLNLLGETNDNDPVFC